MAKEKYAQATLEYAQVAQPSAHAHQPVRSGALTILITVVALSLAVLSVLSLSTARADLALTSRMQQTAKQTGLTEAAAQEWLAQVALSVKNAEETLEASNANKLLKNLPNGTDVSDQGVVQAKIMLDNSEYILVQVQINSSEKHYEVVQWQLLRQWTADEDLELWSGD